MQSHDPRESSYQNPDPGISPTISEKSTYSDSSGAIFSMYINRAQKFDEENVENWKGGAEGILVFTGLFASTVATFISTSYQSLQQDPNAITQSLLVQISQQLPGSPNATTTAASPSIKGRDSFKPPASAVFVNSVWFLSLVLSLTCALMATFLQQWARRYLQLTQRNHPPHVRAHIREYFARGVDRFRMLAFVEALPALLLTSVLLFLSGLVVFAFRGNNFVAFITLAIVAFCALSYIALTLAPLISHDCPYQTPLSTLFWFCAQVIPLSIFSAAHHGAKFFGNKLGVGNTGIVEALGNRQINKKKAFSQGMIATLEGSAMSFSLDIYRAAICWTLSLLDDDHRLEEFVAGIPGLSKSEALRKLNSNSPYHAGQMLLATLPGPAAFHEQLPWSIVQLSQRSIASGLEEFIRRRRTRVCLKALYYIPGAIRDILAPYASGKYYCLNIFPLLNSPESLDLIEELGDAAKDDITNNDIALSVRCVAAAISAFIITPPDTVHKFLSPGVRFIGGEEPGLQFLSRRLHMVENGKPDDSARLQNIVIFLKGIRAAISSMDQVVCMRSDSGGSLLDEVRTERKLLRESRHEPEYRSGEFSLHGNRTSPAFISAVQHDLLALTLEIVTRDSVTDAGRVQRNAFREVFSELETLVNTAGPEGRIVETAEMVVGALRPVADKLELPVSTPQFLPEPRNQLPMTSSGAASSSTAQGVGVEPGPGLRAGDSEVIADRLPPAFPGAVSFSAIEGVTTTPLSASAPASGSTTGTSPTSPNEPSYLPHSFTSSSERGAGDTATLV